MRYVWTQCPLQFVCKNCILVTLIANEYHDSKLVQQILCLTYLSCLLCIYRENKFQVNHHAHLADRTIAALFLQDLIHVGQVRPKC